MTQQKYKKMSDSEKKKEDWMNSKWRPMMGWMYMAVCTADFMLFPILWSLIQAAHGGRVETQWIPITLQGAGLFHIAMGAIIGVAAYGRTQEKLAGANNGGMQPAGMGGFGGMNSGSSMGMNNSFGSSSGFSSPRPMMSAPTPAISGAPVFRSNSGKSMPAPQEDPPL